MSIQDDRELRERLTALLEDITPSPAPVTRAVRQGNGIRMRRWVSAAVVLVVIAAAAAITPALLRLHTASPAVQLHHTPRHYKVTVLPVGSKAAIHGVLAQGVANGKSWKIVASGSGQGMDYQVTGQVTGQIGNDSYVSMPVLSGGEPVSTEGDSSGGYNGFSAIVGAVSKDVASVTVSLPNGDLLRLTPAAWHGRRWIGLVLPGGVPIARAVAYSRDGRELAYSVPFGDTNLAVWWAPGQAGPAPVSRTIGSGVVNGRPWKITARFGPWGYCYVWADGGACLDQTSNPELERLGTGQLIAGISCGPVANAGSAIIGTQVAARDVGAVVLKFSDGTSASFRTVEVLGGRSLGYAIPRHLTVVRSVEYGLSGRVIGSTNGTIWNCGGSAS